MSELLGRLFREFVVPRVKFLRELQEQLYLIGESSQVPGSDDGDTQTSL